MGTDQIQRGLSVADQLPQLLHSQAGGMGQQQVGAVAPIRPGPYVAEPAAQAQPAHLAAQRRCGTVNLSVAGQAPDMAQALPAAETDQPGRC